MVLAYRGSKGWYVAELKKVGINRHPEEFRKLEQYKTYVLRKLYENYVLNTK